MDDQQNSAGTATSDDDQQQILPPVQFGGGDQGGGVESYLTEAQTVPNDRALVPIPAEAADIDLIEKEWVLKAKQIVEKTSEDPFTQQEELSKMKAEYLKKRYKRNIA